MCDELTEKDIDRFTQGGGALNRRDFGKFTAALGMMAMLPGTANALEVTGADVTVATPDGEADCYFVHPSTGKHPGILIWPDILGLRPAFRSMATRLAESGYSVLLVNPYYRAAASPVVPEGATFRDPEIRERVLPLARQLTAETTRTDAIAFIEFLDKQDSVDTKRKIGTAGYCMGGPMIMRTAAAMPERVGAAASFHGGGLATDKDGSPHLLIPTTTAEVLHAVAANDDERSPEVKTVLAKAYADAGIAAEIEVYPDTLHGWCPPDSPVYNEQQAERAWSRLLALYQRAL